MDFRFDSPAAFARRFLLKPAVCAVVAAAAVWAQSADEWIIETVAGSSSIGDGGAAVRAQLRSPAGAAADGAGNLYIADSSNQRVRKVDAAGVITTVAGTGERGYGGDGGAAVRAQLNFPSGAALDAAGNLYIADRDNQRIRKVDAAGIITTVAGTGERGYGGDGGAAVQAQLSSPQGVAVDGAGNLYIADRDNHRIRKVDTAGMITTAAGTGGGIFGGYGGDGGAAIRAQLKSPRGVAADGAGNLYIADTGNYRIRKVDAAGVITTAAGTGERGYGGDGGAATAAQLRSPMGVAADGAGNLYIADENDQRIRKVDAAGVIATAAGTGERGYGGDGGTAVRAQLDSPSGAAADGAGNLYIIDSGNHRIRKMDAAGVITTAAGPGDAGDGGTAVQVQLRYPPGVAADGAGNLYIADSSNHRVRKVDAAGVITTAAGTGERGYGGDGGAADQARLDSPSGVAADGAGNLYIADSGNNRVRRVNAAGVIAAVAGTGERGYGGDGGAADQARLSSPAGVAVDGAGNLYIADSGNYSVRKVDTAGVIATVAGTGESGSAPDGGSAIQTPLRSPSGVAADGAGNLYIADENDYRVRKVDAAGVITTVAGTGERGYAGDGGAATAAQLDSPASVAADEAGNLYIADTYNQRIRRVDAEGVITTVAGTGERGYGGDGGAAVQAQLSLPRGVAADAAGNLYIADSGNYRVRLLAPRQSGNAPAISDGGVILASGRPLVRRISPNAIISVFGLDFARQGTRTLTRLDAAGRIAANLSGTCLEIGGRRAPLFIVTPGQINAQVPHDLPLGQRQAEVVRNCGAANERRGASVTVTAEAVSPAFFNLQVAPDGAGRIPVVAVHGGGPALVGAPGLLPGAEFTPAAPGGIVTLYGTGFGATEPPLETGQIPGGAARLVNAAAFAVGGIAVPAKDVLYAGASPCCAGLYQFTILLPAALPDGDAGIRATVQGVETPAGPFLTVQRQ